MNAPGATVDLPDFCARCQEPLITDVRRRAWMWYRLCARRRPRERGARTAQRLHKAI